MFGQELWVGHLAMWPFLMGIVVLAYKIANHFFNKFGVVILLLLIAVDPFILGQGVLVSPDVPVLFGWLLGVYAVLKNKNIWKVIAAILLAMLSMRGMMLVVVLFLFDLLKEIEFDRISVQGLTQKIAPYVPSGLFGLAFLIAHYQYAGWIGYHENSSWAASFERVDLLGGLRNVGLIIWRMLDFGRIGICLLLSIGGVFYLYRNGLKNKHVRALLVLLIASVFVLTPSLIIHRALSAHRYLMPITTIMSFATVFVLLEIIKSEKWQKIIASVLVVSLLAGNAWVYPKKIAQGWDSTLGHWPYYSLRSEMIDYLLEQNISLEKIGTAFPNRTDLKYTDLNPGVGAFSSYDLESQSYILYSNIYNDFTDEAIDEMEEKWLVKKRLDSYPVCLILYQKK
ncbi:MAG: hypothetical protein AB8F74_04480 [Saprospiraceae bacterium]